MPKKFIELLNENFQELVDELILQIKENPTQLPRLWIHPKELNKNGNKSVGFHFQLILDECSLGVPQEFIK